MTWLFTRGSFQFEGNLLLTSPNENKRQVHVIAIANRSVRHTNNNHSSQQLLLSSQHQQNRYGAVGSSCSETLGTVDTDDPLVISSPQSKQQSSHRQRNPTTHSTTAHSQQQSSQQSTRHSTSTHSVRTDASYHTARNTANLDEVKYTSDEEHQSNL